MLYFVTGVASRFDEKTTIVRGMTFNESGAPGSNGRGQVSYGKNGDTPAVQVVVEVEQEASQVSSDKQDEEFYPYK